MKSIRLRGAKEEDFEIYYKIRSDKGDIYWNGYLKKPDRDSFEELYYSRMSTSPFDKPEDRRNYIIEIYDGMNLYDVGFLQLIRRDEGVEIGYSVMEEFQGLGYATRALKLGIKLAKKYSDTIIVRIRDDNYPSQKVAKRNGFLRTENYELVKYPNMEQKIALRYYILKCKGE